MDDELRTLDWACHQLLDDPVLRRYSTDPGAARLLEDEIERRGLWRAYAEALEHIVVIECADTNLDLLATNDRVGIDWLLIRATPEQKCRAFLAVMEHQL